MEAPTAAPKPMQLVISAITNLQEPNGATPGKIAKYIMSRYPTDASKLKRQVDTALKRGVTWGILRKDNRRYQLDDLNDGSQHMRTHRRRRRRRRSSSGHRHRRGGRRGSSRRRRRRHSRSGSRRRRRRQSSSESRRRRGGRRRRSSHTRQARRSHRRRANDDSK